MFERRFGGIGLRWDFHSWGLGVSCGAYRDNWLFVKPTHKYYWAAWAKCDLGPFSIEVSLNGPGREWPLPEFKLFCELMIGTVFEVNENTDAIKVSNFSGLTDKGKYVHYSGDDMVQTWDYIWGE